MHRENVGHRGKLLAEAGRHLMENYKIMEDNPRKMSIHARKTLLEIAINHVVMYEQAGGH